MIFFDVNRKLIQDANGGGNLSGCEEILKAVVKRIRPKYHLFGHIHEGNSIRFVYYPTLSRFYIKAKFVLALDMPSRQEILLFPLLEFCV
jgi:hypothetical protein